MLTKKRLKAVEKKKMLEEMTFQELIDEKESEIEVGTFLDFSADEVSEEEKLKLKRSVYQLKLISMRRFERQTKKTKSRQSLPKKCLKNQKT